MKEYLECGFITAIHGLKGAVIVKHVCDSYEAFASLKKVYIEAGNSYSCMRVIKISPYKGNALVYLDGVDDADKASALRKRTLFAHRDDIPKDEGSFFIADLIGLEVLDANTGIKYGVLKDVINSGAQDIYVVEAENGRLSYVPAIQEFVSEISLENGILITPIEGMIE
ncbi:MAG: 16S rRNA processing protein RimM [Clostridia bacterium]|nr:16S rRNA processing protein RimM [Clostridia bacterium]